MSVRTSGEERIMLTHTFVRNFHPSLPANARQFNETEQAAFLNTKHNTVCAPYTAAFLNTKHNTVCAPYTAANSSFN